MIFGVVNKPTRYKGVLRQSLRLVVFRWLEDIETARNPRRHDFIEQRTDVWFQRRRVVRVWAEHIEQKVSIVYRVIGIQQPLIVGGLSKLDRSVEGVSNLRPARRNGVAIGQLNMPEGLLVKSSVPAPMRRVVAAYLEVVEVDVKVVPVRQCHEFVGHEDPSNRHNASLTPELSGLNKILEASITHAGGLFDNQDRVVIALLDPTLWFRFGSGNATAGKAKHTNPSFWGS